MNSISSVLAKLHEIGTVLSRPIMGESLAETLQHVCRRLLDLFDADHSTITLLDETGRFFRVEAEYPRLPLRLVGEPILIQDRPTQVGLVDRHEPVIADVLKDHRLISESPSFRRIAQALDIKSLLIVPMVADGYTIGTISIDMIDHTRGFTPPEVELCEVVAAQVATFITITRLRNEQQNYRHQAEMLASMPTRTTWSIREEMVALTLFDELRRVIQFKKASVQLIVEDKRTLVGAFGFDKYLSNKGLLRPVEADPIIQEIVHTQKRKILPNTAIAAHWEKQVGTIDVNSWIAIPLIFYGEVIGILTLDHDQAGFYADIEEDVLARLDELTAKAARDLAGTYNLEMAQQQIRALDIIGRFSETVATKLDPQELQLSIVSMISEGLECARCSIFLVEQRDTHDFLVCKAICQTASCATTSELVLSDPGPHRLLCPVRHAFQKGESTFIYNREEAPDFDFSHELYRGARSMIAVPLKIANQVIGVLLAIDERPGWFSRADQLLLETLARQAASAIERDFGLDLVHSIGNKILGATEVHTVLKDVVSGAMKLTHTDSGVIYELSEDYGRVIRAFKDEGSVHPEPRLDDPNGITRTVISTRRMEAISDIEKDRRVNPALRGRYRSMFAVPLLLGESVVGVLYLNGKNVRGLTETERSLLDTLAGQAALAIQRTRLYEQIRDSDAMYRSLMDHIPQFVFRKDRNSRFTWANASFCKSLKRSLNEVIGKSDLDFYPKENAKKYIRGDREVMHSEQSVTFDEEHQPPGGQPRILVRVVKTPVLDSRGGVIGVQAIFWDITKEVEERKLAQRWQALAKQSPDGIVVHERGKITLANPAAVRLFGACSADELKNHSILDFVDSPSRPLAKERLDKLDRGEDVEPMVEMCVLREDGKKVDVEVYTRCVPETGTIQVVFHDLTRIKRLLREMHHRVGGSLNQVDGFLTRQEEFTEATEVLHAFDTIRERIQAVSLIHRILYRTQKESDVNMELYLRDLVEALIKGHDSPGRVIIESSASGIILDEKRATACGLIVTELVSNSLLHAFPPKVFSPGSGRVSVCLSPGKDEFRLVVSDNGIGIPTPFRERAESMGLSLVQSLVIDDLEGVVDVSPIIETKASERGTRFCVRFADTIGRRIEDDGR